MSGGRFDYKYFDIMETYKGQLEFPILENLLKDFCEILKSLEWYKSGDTSQEAYEEDVKKFILKWFETDQKTKILAKSEVIKQLEDVLNKMKEES